MDPSPTVEVAIAPFAAPWLADAVGRGGGVVVEPAHATALVWDHPDDPAGLAALLDAHPAIRWVQLPWAGIEPYVPVLDADRTWSCAKGVYADPVAEHALALALAGLRNLHVYASAASWGAQAGRNLIGASVTIVGGGGIAESLLGLLAPFRCRTTVVRRRPEPMAGASDVVGIDQLLPALASADVVVLALALVPDTVGIIGPAELDAMAPHAWLVNVARGQHVQTDALVAALRAGSIGGAALDVTEPEPLPDGHALWALPNAIITPHTANTQEMARPLLAARVEDNVRRRLEGRPLVGLVDLDLGY